MMAVPGNFFLILGLYEALRSLTVALVVGRVALRPCLPSKQALYSMAISRPVRRAILHSASLLSGLDFIDRGFAIVKSG